MKTKLNVLFLSLLAVFMAASLWVSIPAGVAKAETTSVDILTTTVPEPPVTIGGTQGIGDRVAYSYELGMPAYEMTAPTGHNNLWWLTLNFMDLDTTVIEGDKALSFWLYADKPLTGTVDTRVELSSSGLDHDYGQWYWSVNELFGSADFQLGQWNHFVLELESSKWTQNSTYNPDFTRINFFRIFTMLPDSSNTFLANIQVIAMPEDGQSGIREHKEPLLAEITDEELPAEMAEYDTLELPAVTATDPTGASIPVSFEVTGPNNFRKTGNSILLDGGAGEYTVRYQATDGLGFVTESVHTITVTADGPDSTAPTLVFPSTYPAEVLGNTLHDFAEGIVFYDNRGTEGLTVSAKLIDPNGKTVFSYDGLAAEFELIGKTTMHGTYTVEIAVSDTSGNSQTYQAQVLGYLEADTEKSVPLLDFGGNTYVDPGYTDLCRIVNARPENSTVEQSLEFDYRGGAANIYDPDTYFHAVVLRNEVAPDISDLDIKYLAVRMNLYIDAVYPTDGVATPSDGSGYGNMVFGFSSQSNYGGNARAEFNMRDLGLQVGWNDVIFKFGNIADSYNGTFDPANITTFYISTNWGSARRFLFNDVRFVETDQWGRETYVPFATSIVATTQPGDSIIDFEEGAEYSFLGTGCAGSPVWLPNISMETSTGGFNELTDFDITVRNAAGEEYDVEQVYGYTFSSNYFIPDEAGNYTVLYEATDIFGRPAILERSIAVEGAFAAPEITLGAELPTYVRRGEQFTLPQITAKDGAGSALTVQILWINPDGTVQDISDSRSITPELSGRNVLKLIATDEKGQKTVMETRIPVRVTYSSVYSPQRYQQALFFLIVGICAGVVIVGGGLGLFFGLRHKKRKAAAAAAPAETDGENTPNNS